MKYQLEIFIEGQRLDVFEYESITIKQSIKDLKRVDKIFTPFSQSFTVPASKANNKALKHYYNASIENGFDARTYASAELKINGESFDDGNIALESVKMKFGSPESYKLRYYGRLTELSKQMGEDYLHQLDFTDLDLPVSTFNMGTQLGASVLNSSGYHADLRFFSSSKRNRLIYHSGQSTYALNQGWENVKNVAYVTSARSEQYGLVDDDVYASLKVGTIVEKIEAKYPIKFEGLADKSYINNYRLVLNKASRTQQEGVVSSIVDSLPSSTNDSTIYEVLDGTNINVKDKATGGGFSIDNILFGSNNFTIRGRENYQLRYCITSNATNYKLNVLVNGEKANTSSKEVEQTGLDTVLTSGFLGFNMANKGVDQRINLGAYDGDANIKFQIETSEAANFTIKYRFVRFVNKNAIQSYSSHTATYSTSSGGARAYEVGSNMPKLKVKDFISTLFKQFNLVATVTKDDTYGNIVNCKHYDHFINSGSELDITEFTDISNSTIEPTTNYSGIEFNVNEPKAAMEIAFDKVNNRRYGALEYTLNDSEGKIKGKPFEFDLNTHKLPYERLNDLNDDSLTVFQYAQFTDLESQSVDLGVTFTYLMNAYDELIAYDNGTTVQSVGNPLVPVSYYNSSSGFLLEPSTSLRVRTNHSGIVGDFFGAESDEFFRDARFSKLGHVNLFWDSYLNILFDSRNRKVSISSYLPQSIIRTLSPADKIIINDRKHIIESFKTNFSTGLTKFELVEVSDFVYSKFESNDVTIEGPSVEFFEKRAVFMNSSGVIQGIDLNLADIDVTVIGEIKSEYEYRN